ncbi:VanZ family protein [Aquiflexum balticum]|uniref:VanZ family protein n=1 Tax=Aquiflexum balticum TaxID=280473 RepID=UPI002937237E|nr:VanZ family protein [Aquiflexum balticum]
MKLKRLIPALFWLIIVSLLLWTPGNTLKNFPVFSVRDKLGHFILFATLSFLWLRIGSINSERLINMKYFITNLLVFVLIFPILAEYLQLFVPNRTFDYYDIVANLVGGIFGFMTFFILYKAGSKLV